MVNKIIVNQPKEIIKELKDILPSEFYANNYDKLLLQKFEEMIKYDYENIEIIVNEIFDRQYFVYTLRRIKNYKEIVFDEIKSHIAEYNDISINCNISKKLDKNKEILEMYYNLKSDYEEIKSEIIQEVYLKEIMQNNDVNRFTLYYIMPNCINSTFYFGGADIYKINFEVERKYNKFKMVDYPKIRVVVIGF